MNIIDVPRQFQPSINVEYPPGNKIIFEQWLIDNVGEFESDRWYLPVNWCGFYVNNKYGKNRNAMMALDRFLCTLDKKKKYWTVTQYDLGIISNLAGLDIKIFGAGGGRIDFPIPLLCQSDWHQNSAVVDQLVFFAGGDTHPIRKQMLKHCSPEWDVRIANNLRYDEYRIRMERATFTLCPRGFGPTSFRICEAIQSGSIPVYISDEFVIPGNMPFDKYGVLIKDSELLNLKDILIAEVDNQLQLMNKIVAGSRLEMFTYEGCRKLILENL